MNKDYLIKKANHLKAIDEKASDEYFSKMGKLVSIINDTILNRPDVEKLIGKNNLEMVKDNHQNHARFMYSVMKDYNSDVLVETVIWVFNAYQNHGFSSNYWAAQLNAWISILEKELSESTFKQIFPFYEFMQVNIPVFVEVAKTVENNPHA